MPRKADLREVDRIARKFRMTPEQRRAFGNQLEDSKAHGEQGTKNERGDFTREELLRKAREFLGLPEED